MGIDTQAVIVVGYTHRIIQHLYDAYLDEYNEKINEPMDFQDWYEYKELDRISPYYDAPDEYCLFGRTLDCTRNYDFVELSVDWLNDEPQDYFVKKFDLEPTIWLSPWVS